MTKQINVTSENILSAARQFPKSELGRAHMAISRALNRFISGPLPCANGEHGRPGYAMLAHKLMVRPTTQCQTMCTDGKRLFYNPLFVLSILDQPFHKAVKGGQVVDLDPMDKLCVIVAHESLHGPMGHTLRIPTDREGQHAADHEVNLTLVADGWPMPTEAICDTRFVKDGTDLPIPAELIYQTLIAEKPEPQPGQPGQGQGQGEGQGSGQNSENSEPGTEDQNSPELPDNSSEKTEPDQCGDTGGGFGEFFRPSPELPGNPTPEQVQQAIDKLAEEILEGMQQAELAETSKRAGNSGGALARKAKEIRHVPADWRAELAEFATVLMSGDISWDRADHRFVHQGLYLPSDTEPGIGNLCIMIDVSGSISEKELAIMQAETREMAEVVNPETITLVYWDSATRKVTVNPGHVPIELESVGGGGTKVQMPFATVALGRHGETSIDTPDIAVVLSDMMFHDDYPTDPGYPVIWASTSDPRYTARKPPPFGRVINVRAK